jgi:hypothetical protein
MYDWKDILKNKLITTPVTDINIKKVPKNPKDRPCWRELTEMADAQPKSPKYLFNDKGGVYFDYEGSYAGDINEPGLEVPPEEIACWFLDKIKSINLKEQSSYTLQVKKHNGVRYTANIGGSHQFGHQAGKLQFYANLGIYEDKRNWPYASHIYNIQTSADLGGFPDVMSERQWFDYTDRIWEILFHEEWATTEREDNTRININEINELFEIHFDWRK